MATKNSVIFNIIAKDNVSKVLKDVKATVRATAGSIASATRSGIASLALTAGGIAGVGSAFLDSIGIAEQYQSLSAQTAAVLKSTGNAAGTSGQHIRDLAASLESTSRIDEELIINSQNVLATFTGVRNEVGKGNDIFDQATAAALGVSSALKTDLQSATIMVGKSLNNPVKGMAALSRAGVSFTEKQKAQVKALVASGDTMGAQKVILRELSKEFGGAAKASGEGFGGAMFRLKDVIGDTQRTLGTALLPILTRLANWATAKIPVIVAAVGTFAGAWGGSGGGGWIGTTARTLRTVYGVLQSGAQWVERNRVLVTSFAVGVLAVVSALKIYQMVVTAAAVVQGIFNAVMAANPVGLIVLAVIGLGAALIYAYKHSETFRNIVNGAVRAVGAAFGWVWKKASEVLGWIRSNWSLIAAVLTGPIGFAVRWIVTHLDDIKAAGNRVVGWFRGMPGKIRSALVNVGNILAAPFRSGFNMIASAWNNTAGRLSFTMPGWVPGMGGRGFSMPTLPMLAKGGRALTSGLAIVGEAGPEILNLERGATVAPLGPLATRGGSGGVTVTLDMTGGSDELLDWLRRRVRVGGGVTRVLGTI